MKRMMKFTTLALLSLGMLAACGKKGSGGTAATTGLTQNCGNCAGITASLLAVAQIQGSPVSGVIELHGEQSIVQSAIQEAAWKMGSAQYAYNYYMGPVIVAGQLNVSTAMPVGYCVVPVGTYNVRTVSVGQKMEYGSGSSFTVQEVVLDGPQQFRVRIGQTQNGLPSVYLPSSGTAVLGLTFLSCI